MSDGFEPLVFRSPETEIELMECRKAFLQSLDDKIDFMTPEYLNGMLTAINFGFYYAVDNIINKKEDTENANEWRSI